MRIPRPVAAAGITAVVAAVASGSGWNSGASGAVKGAGLADVAIRPGVQHVGHAQLSPPTTASCRKDYKVACYQPTQIQQAYHLPALYARGITGRGTTIVIVDSFGSPTISSDLAAFDQAFGLPTPPSFRIIAPAARGPRVRRPARSRPGFGGRHGERRAVRPRARSGRRTLKNP